MRRAVVLASAVCGVLGEWKCHRECGTEYEPVCGSNGMVFSNRCIFERVQCEDPSLKEDRSCHASGCPEGCASWFDGCNKCRCNENRELVDCTEKACRVRLPKEAARCVEFEAQAAQTICPPRCKLYYDGCNECDCDENGVALSCTDLTCVMMGAPTCLDKRRIVDLHKGDTPPLLMTADESPTEENLDASRADEEIITMEPVATVTLDVDPGFGAKCPTGCALWFNGCNVCTCREDGKPLYCSPRYCSPSSFKPPFCVEGFRKTEACEDTCTDDYDPLCGSDGEIYQNRCMLNIAICNEPTLTETKCEDATTRGRRTTEGHARRLDLLAHDRLCDRGCEVINDGCNLCTCKRGKVAKCSMRVCVDGDIKEPRCEIERRDGDEERRSLLIDRLLGDSSSFAVIRHGTSRGVEKADEIEGTTPPVLTSTTTWEETGTTKDCGGYCPMNYDPICSTDGTTHGNRCVFKFHLCLDPTLVETPCENLSRQEAAQQEPSPTPTPTAPLASECNPACPYLYSPVCATNGVVYGNECQYDYARCLDSSVGELQSCDEAAAKSSSCGHKIDLCFFPIVAAALATHHIM